MEEEDEMMEEEETRGERIFYLIVFIVGYIVAGFEVLKGYEILFLEPLKNFSVKQSELILFGMVAFSIAFCRLILFRGKRTIWSIVVSLCLPCGIYTYLSSWNTLGIWPKGILENAIVLSIAYGILVIKSWNRGRGKRHFYHWMKRTVNIMALAMIVSFGGVIVQGVGSAFGFTPKNHEEVIPAVPSATIADNKDTILKLQTQEWSRLTVQEKKEVLQCIMDIEANHLGISGGVTVYIDDLEGGGVRRSSDFDAYIIDNNYLDTVSEDEILWLCSHMIYHCYQTKLVEAYENADVEARRLLMYKKTKQYAREFSEEREGDGENTYINVCGDDSLQSEEAARKYANDTVDKYDKWIELWIDVQNSVTEKILWKG